MILDPRTLLLMRGLTILQPVIRLFSGRGLHCSPLLITAVEDTRQVCSLLVVVGGGGGARAPTVETTGCCAQLDCFDCDVPV